MARITNEKKLIQKQDFLSEKDLQSKGKRPGKPARTWRRHQQFFKREGKIGGPKKGRSCLEITSTLGRTVGYTGLRNRSD